MRLTEPTKDLRITAPLKVLDDVVDRDGMDSFPASDPPAHWRGEDTRPPNPGAPVPTVTPVIPTRLDTTQ